MSELALHAKWINPQQAGVSLNSMVVPWCKSMMAAGHALAVEIRLAEDAKTDQQRKYYHGVILKQIAEQASPNGQKFPLAVWKEHFRAQYLGFKTTTFVNPLTGKKSRRRVRKSTEDLGVKAYNELIERVTAFAVTELGVVFAELPGLTFDPETGEILEPV
jgi:hypothetical protein